MNPSDALALEWIATPARTAGCVICTGVFDLLHIGHLRFLQAARAAGELLCVGVESDARVRHRKGSERPLVPAAERAELVAGLAGVDGAFVVHGPADRWDAPAYASAFAALAPAALALTAGDPAEQGKRAAAALLGADVIVLPLVERRSTSDLVSRARATLAC
jgi:cytidyltransferase-like protein